MFTVNELNILIMALNSKIADDIYQIEFWEKEIGKNKSNHDKKYLDESKAILKRDIDLKEKIYDELYSTKLNKISIGF
ncbi:MAG: hypothetical protein NTV45_03690 [Firmicutes bacterium]|nr:hypothetical protein [Bacillota bacterium]